MLSERLSIMNLPKPVGNYSELSCTPTDRWPDGHFSCATTYFKMIHWCETYETLPLKTWLVFSPYHWFYAWSNHAKCGASVYERTYSSNRFYLRKRNIVVLVSRLHPRQRKQNKKDIQTLLTRWSAFMLTHKVLHILKKIDYTETIGIVPLQLCLKYWQRNPVLLHLTHTFNVRATFIQHYQIWYA